MSEKQKSLKNIYPFKKEILAKYIGKSKNFLYSWKAEVLAHFI